MAKTAIIKPNTAATTVKLTTLKGRPGFNGLPQSYHPISLTLNSEAKRFNWISASIGSRRKYFVNWANMKPAAILAQ